MKKVLATMSSFSAFVIMLTALTVPVSAIVSAREMSMEDKKQFIEEYKNNERQKKQELREQAKKEAEELREQAKKEAELKKQQAQEAKLQKRQEVCQQKAEKLGQKVTQRQQKANEFLVRFDGFYAKVESFIDNKQLKIDDYETVTAEVLLAKKQATLAVNKLSELTFDVDCQEVDATSQNTKIYRDALIEAKEALKEYRRTLVNFLTAVVTSYNQSVKEESSTESTEQETEATESTESSETSAGTNAEAGASESSTEQTETEVNNVQ